MIMAKGQMRHNPILVHASDFNERGLVTSLLLHDRFLAKLSIFRRQNRDVIGWTVSFLSIVLNLVVPCLTRFDILAKFAELITAFVIHQARSE